MAEEWVGEIVERGFTVRRGFLDAEEVALFAEEYRNGTSLQNQMYTLGFADPSKVEKIKPVIRDMLDTLREESDIDINFVGGGVYFSIGNGIDFSWHQDHESYFMQQTHRNYLNFFIPVIKPDPSRSNLSVIPADRLAEEAPDLWARLENSGASSAVWREGKTVFTDDCHGGIKGMLDLDINEIAETPELNAGDALILRGDIFHSTQDTETDRVALSVRAMNDSHQVHRDHFLQSCETKDVFMERNAQMYDRIRRVFEDHDSLTYRELMDKAWQQPESEG